MTIWYDAGARDVCVKLGVSAAWLKTKLRPTMGRAGDAAATAAAKAPTRSARVQTIRDAINDWADLRDTRAFPRNLASYDRLPARKR